MEAGTLLLFWRWAFENRLLWQSWLDLWAEKYNKWGHYFERDIVEYVPALYHKLPVLLKIISELPSCYVLPPSTVRRLLTEIKDEHHKYYAAARWCTQWENRLLGRWPVIPFGFLYLLLNYQDIDVWLLRDDIEAMRWKEDIWNRLQQLERRRAAPALKPPMAGLVMSIRFLMFSKEVQEMPDARMIMLRDLFTRLKKIVIEYFAMHMTYAHEVWQEAWPEVCDEFDMWTVAMMNVPEIQLRNPVKVMEADEEKGDEMMPGEKCLGIWVHPNSKKRPFN